MLMMFLMVFHRDHQPIMLEADQEVIIYAAGADYTTWEGYKTAEETKIGVSYAKLCTDINPGQTILIADGTICIQVMPKHLCLFSAWGLDSYPSVAVRSGQPHLHGPM
jgi:hypothetical protein